jgi:hypothetical protein
MFFNGLLDIGSSPVWRFLVNGTAVKKYFCLYKLISYLDMFLLKIDLNIGVVSITGCLPVSFFTDVKYFNQSEV